MKNSQENKILAYMQSGKSITPIEALNLFGCFRLGARCFNLRKKGYPINSEIVNDGDKHYSRYSLKGA